MFATSYRLASQLMTENGARNRMHRGAYNTQRSDLRFCEACGPVCSTELYSYTVFRHELMFVGDRERPGL